MYIELRIGNETKTFKTGFISGMVFRNAIQMQKKVRDDGLQVELIDDLVHFVVDVFGNQFTVEEFYHGIEACKMFDIIMDVIMYCINGEEVVKNTQC